MQTKSLTGISLIKDLYLKNRNFCSKDYDECLEYLNQILPFTIHVYDQEYNDWQIPPKWDLEYAYIKDTNGKIIYEVDHPLKIIGLSTSFYGKVSKEKLLKHLHYDHRYDDAVPYHFRQFYRPWDRTWGFCVPKTFYDSLKDTSYFVEIKTKESIGNLKIATHTKKGTLPHTFTFVAHLDHPGMVNDDLSGVAVGVELFEKIKELNTKFTYQLVIVPEIIGSEFYLGHNCPKKNNVLEGCFLEMLASNTPLALQRSHNETSQLETTLLKNLNQKVEKFTQGPFKSIICNDECIWEAYQVPMCSLSRFPYKEYHTHKDDLSILNENAFKEAIEILYQTILELDKQILIQKKFIGTPCLSHPKYDLYIDPGQRAFGTHADKKIQKLRLLMDSVFSKPSTFFLNEICSELELPKTEALSFFKKWQQKNLIKIL